MEIEIALYMIPVPISDGNLDRVLPAENKGIVMSLRHFIVENVRTARRFLKKLAPAIDIAEINFYELNGHTDENEISTYLEPLRKGSPMGIMSEAGCPGVADPGAQAVAIAQQEGRKVIPLVGPSSILMSLMASGLNGQKFAFQGYLPVKDPERDKVVKSLESESRRNDMTQIFIETPYRNEKMMECLMKNLGNDTLVCVASDISNPQGEKIVTKTVKEWKTERIKLEKVPTIFLLYSPASTGRKR